MGCVMAELWCENDRMRHPMTTADGRACLRALSAAVFLFSFEEFSFAAVVTAAVQDLYVRPDETSSVVDQVILGERVEILEDAAGFARVRTAAGEVAWIPESALRPGDAPAPAGAEAAPQGPSRGGNGFFGLLRR